MTQFSTWSGSASCSPTAILEPASEAEVVAIVQRALASGRRVKAVGAGHSFSDIAMTDGDLVRLDKMDAIVRVDKQRNRVTAQAGMRLKSFNGHLDGVALALPIVGSIEEQSLAGLVATGTHGSSLRHGNLSNCVVAMRIVTGRGEVLVLEEGDERLPAARLGLGALGIVTELTFAVEPAFRIREETVPMAFEAAVDAFPEYASAYEYAKFWWVPHTNRAQLFRGVRTDEASTFSEALRTFDTRVINGVVFPAVLGFGNAFPSLIPALNAAIGAVYFQPKTTIGVSHRVLGLAMPPVHRESEFAIPLEHAGAALRRLRTLIVDKHLHINFILEARLVREDDTWMSPAYGRNTVQIGAYTTYLGDKETWFSGAEAIFREYGGRPHWGKEATLEPARIAALYPRAGEFLALAHACDPSGVFSNPFLQKCGRLTGGVSDSTALG